MGEDSKTLHRYHTSIIHLGNIHHLRQSSELLIEVPCIQQERQSRPKTNDLWCNNFPTMWFYFSHRQ